MTFSEWKRQRDAKARAAGGGAVISLEAVRAQLAEADRVLAASRAQRARALQLVGYGSEDQAARPGVWDDYVKVEREAGRLPVTVTERARAAGMPVKDRVDYRRMKGLFGKGGDAA